MDGRDPFEPGTHIFTGIVRKWRGNFCEFLTDSGIVVPLVTQGISPLTEGERMTITAKKYRPHYQVVKVHRSSKNE